MLDLKTNEPNIQILYPLLIHYSPEAAILYGYLKDQCRHAEPVTERENEKYFELVLNRYETELATGLTAGEQVDAEVCLQGSDLVTSGRYKGDAVIYQIYPDNEETLRRFVHKKRHRWNY